MTLSTQFMTMLSMIGMGIIFGMMLDTYQRFLNRPKRKHWITFINDILFWAIQAMLIFYTLFIVNQGELRFYIFIALICGFAAYQALFKRIYLALLGKLISIVILFAKFLAQMIKLLLIKPVVGIIQFAIALLLFIYKGLAAIVKFILKSVFVILRILLTPFGKMLMFFWELLPKGFKMTVRTLYNKWTRIIKKISNKVYSGIQWWKNRKK